MIWVREGGFIRSGYILWWKRDYGKGRSVWKVLTEVYCVWVDDRATIRFRLVMDDCCIRACRGNSVKRKADKIFIFPIECYLNIIQK